MVLMRLDLEGRLLLFEAIPPQVEPGAAPPQPDWNPLFAAAALDPAQFRPADPRWTPGMAFDTRAAWEGAWPGVAIPIRVEAAAWRGKPVSFRVVEPWTPAERDEAPPYDFYRLLLYLMYWVLAFPVAVVLAWRNLKARRGDLPGAARLGAAVILFGNVAGWLGMSHVAAVAEVGHLAEVLVNALGAAAFIMAAYLALEPYVRRRCPRLLISLARLLQGNWRDPLLAANMLAGIAAGVFLILLSYVSDLLMLGAGRLPSPPTDYSSILGARQFAASSIASPAMIALLIALLYLFLFFLARLALRRDYPAAAAVAVAVNALFSPTATIPAVEVPVSFLFTAALLFILVRFGLPAAYTCLVLYISAQPVLTTDPSRWYFSYTLVYFLLILGAAAIAFRLSLGKRKLLRDETLA
jgi:hypothetical protein